MDPPGRDPRRGRGLWTRGAAVVVTLLLGADTAQFAAAVMREPAAPPATDPFGRTTPTRVIP